VLSAGFEHRVSTGLPLVELSADGHGFDARFEPEPGETVEAALRRYGDAGYTRLWTDDPTLPTGIMAMFRPS
jgi:diaminohydroxyphosphoribosylaminopyrimidine deaminase/5-amino-6-(5-phosphoribosylamino)uracil reductase